MREVTSLGTANNLVTTLSALGDPLLKHYSDLIAQGHTGDEYAELTRSQIKKLKSIKRDNQGWSDMRSDFTTSRQDAPLRLKVLDIDRSAS